MSSIPFLPVVGPGEAAQGEPEGGEPLIALGLLGDTDDEGSDSEQGPIFEGIDFFWDEMMPYPHAAFTGTLKGLGILNEQGWQAVTAAQAGEREWLKRLWKAGLWPLGWMIDKKLKQYPERLGE